MKMQGKPSLKKKVVHSRGKKKKANRKGHLVCHKPSPVNNDPRLIKHHKFTKLQDTCITRLGKGDGVAAYEQ